MAQLKYEGWKVGRIIHNERERRGMSLLDLSLAVGMSESHVRQVENGRKMSVDLLYKLINVLEVDANTLLAVPNYRIDGVSIDTLLLTLPLKRQEYFRKVFVQMIQDIPV